MEEVSNYGAALKHGLRRLREDDFPLSLRLIREMHALLLQGGRGASRQPGEFRKTQVWIGGATPALAHSVPPPPEALNDSSEERRLGKAVASKCSTRRFPNP